jgi:hypothetical protein
MQFGLIEHLFHKSLREIKKTQRQDAGDTNAADDNVLKYSLGKGTTGCLIQ